MSSPSVFGGRTGSSRDARMRELIGNYIDVASPTQVPRRLCRAKAPLAPDKEISGPSQIAPPAVPIRAVQTAAAPPQLRSCRPPGPLPGSTEPIKPIR